MFCRGGIFYIYCKVHILDTLEYRPCTNGSRDEVADGKGGDTPGKDSAICFSNRVQYSTSICVPGTNNCDMRVNRLRRHLLFFGTLHRPSLFKESGFVPGLHDGYGGKGYSNETKIKGLETTG